MRGLLLALLLGTCARAESPAALRSLEMGKEAFEAGQYSQALDHFLKVLKLEPQNVEAKSYITRIGESWRQFESQLQVNAQERQETLKMAYQLIRSRKERLAETLEELRQVGRQLEAARIDSGGLLKTSRALTRLDEEKIRDRVVAEQSQYYVQLLQKRLKDAIRQGDVFQNTKDALVARGFLLYYRGDLGQALKEWNKALALAPEDAFLREQVQWAFRKKALAERELTIREILAQARALSKAGKQEQALLSWRSLVLMDPNNTEFQKQMLESQDKVRATKAQRVLRDGYLALRQRQLSRASQLFLEVLEIDPGNREALENLKRIQQELVGPSVPQAPREPSRQRSEEQYTLGLIYYAQGDVGKARKAFETALQYNPKNEKAKNALTRLEVELRP